MFDFRKPKNQRLIKSYKNNTTITFSNNITIFGEKTIINNTYFDKYRIPETCIKKIQTYSDLTVFDVHPNLWKEINHPGFIYLYTLKDFYVNNMAKSLDYYIQGLNQTVSTLDSYNKLYLQLVSDQHFIMNYYEI